MQENTLALSKASGTKDCDIQMNEKVLTAEEFYLADRKKVVASGEYFVPHEGQSEDTPKPTGRIDKFKSEMFYLKFEREHSQDFASCEINRRRQGGEVGEVIKGGELRSDFNRHFNLRPATKTQEKLKAFTLEEWVVMVCRLFDAMPSLINLMDLDIRRIAYTSPVLTAKGMTTIHQLEMMLESKERKEQYLNIYVLNQDFAELLKNDEERKVFRYVLQGSPGKIKKKNGQKLRTAYRIRRNILNRLKEFCISHGFSQDWFYDHFSCLPPVLYLAEK